jgi:PAB-dependent poly(A)-specific ribonuclease subunit 3
VTVGGSKFSHLINIQAFEEKPKPSIILPNVLCQTYRAVNRFNHKASILRRLVECNAQPADCAAVYERFRHFRHPNLIPLLNITQSNEFVLGSNDIIFEYRQVKGAKSFVEHFFTPQDSMPVNVVEGVLWSIGCQLLCLLRAFHEVKTPLRGIHFSKLLWLESAERVLFSGVGLVDIVGPAPQSSFSDCAKGDVISVGVLLLQLASRNPLATERDLHELQNKFYTPGFVKLVRTMIEGNIPVPQLCAALGERMAMEVGHQEGHADYFYGECAKEAHNGRLMKLLMKLNFVIGSFQDTADWGNDANERFAIRMFHSYLFNQVDENNRVRLDWGHVYSCLNKLDCGSDELVHLISTDSNSTIMVVAYRDLRNLLEQIFETLKSQVDALAATPPTMTGY